MPAEYEWVAGIDTHRAGEASESEHHSPGAGSISACLVVRDEAALIERCLQSLRGVVDEIIVVHDCPCGDDTLKIAQRFGCRVFVRPRYGHCEHHLPFAYRRAVGEWLLTIDADEFLSTPLRGQLPVGALQAGPRAAVSNRMVGVIHSKGEVDGPVQRCALQLDHQPPYNNFTIGTIARKWGPRARLRRASI